MNFVISLPLSADWKGNTYDSILVIINCLTKIVHYKPVKVTINTLGLAEVIINVVVRHHGLPDSIIRDQGAIFMSKFWSSLCYFLGIKRRFSTAFHPQTDGQTKEQNSTIKAYLCAFVNWEQNDWVWLLPIKKFAYNNSKNASTDYTFFELNCGYHPRVSFKNKCDVRFRSFSAKKLAVELRKLINVCHQNLLHAQEL